MSCTGSEFRWVGRTPLPKFCWTPPHPPTPPPPPPSCLLHTLLIRYVGNPRARQLRRSFCVCVSSFLGCSDRQVPFSGSPVCTPFAQDFPLHRLIKRAILFTEDNNSDVSPRTAERVMKWGGFTRTSDAGEVRGMLPQGILKFESLKWPKRLLFGERWVVGSGYVHQKIKSPLKNKNLTDWAAQNWWLMPPQPLPLRSTCSPVSVTRLDRDKLLLSLEIVFLRRLVSLNRWARFCHLLSQCGFSTRRATWRRAVLYNSASFRLQTQVIELRLTPEWCCPREWTPACRFCRRRPAPALWSSGSRPWPSSDETLPWTGHIPSLQQRDTLLTRAPGPPNASAQEAGEFDVLRGSLYIQWLTVFSG